MSFEPVIAPDAEENFNQLPTAVQEFLFKEIEELAKDPAGKMKECKASRPYLRVSTLFITEESAYDGETHMHFLIFRISPCERYLQIIAMAVAPPYDPPSW